MSADNWTICPKCLAENPPWQLAMGEPLPDYEHTLREDYEQGMQSDGTYYCIYAAICTACGFKWTHNYTTKAYKKGS